MENSLKNSTKLFCLKNGFDKKEEVANRTYVSFFFLDIIQFKNVTLPPKKKGLQKIV